MENYDRLSQQQLSFLFIPDTHACNDGDSDDNDNDDSDDAGTDCYHDYRIFCTTLSMIVINV